MKFRITTCSLLSFVGAKRLTHMAMVLTTIALAASATGLQAQTEAWPSRPIHIIVPFPAGGASDQLVRPIAQKLQDVLKQTVVVENRTGAGGLIGANSVAKAAPDGYTLLLGTISTHAINPALLSNMPYDAARDFKPVFLLGTAPNVLLAGLQVPFSDLKGMLAEAKRKPGSLLFGSPGQGTSQHLSGELLKQVTGTEIMHVAYKGSPATIQDLIGGHLPLMMDTVLFARPFVESGRVRPLAVTSAKRSRVLPNVPTMQEAGIPGFDVVTWQAIYAPSSTPDAIISRLNQELSRIISDPEIKAKMDSMGLDHTPNTVAQFIEFQRAELNKWRGIVEKSGLKQ